ncbi:MAG: HD-GYP domain-containing protein [Magnetococcales bacterium]|nr:HD-GYP domain-containing protein [Magnetococcales bacterium]MBF0156145.1 HD-GYP domain-containing protein [Magnetococcales bacterium]
MIKRVSVDRLVPGMFVHDFNHDWRDPCCQDRDPNAFRGQRLLRTDEEIQAIIAHGLKELYIDTTKGRDEEEAPTAREVEARLAAQLAALGDEDGEEHPVERPRRTFNEEIGRASEVRRAARKIVGEVLGDARLGQQVQVAQVKSVVQEMAESMFRNPDAVLSLSLIKQRDEYTFMHSVNVGVFLMSFCRALGYDEGLITEVGVGGMLHDIGKMKTPERVLNKPGKLTDEEFQIMKQHVVWSRRVLEESPGISETSLFVASQHHERYDGSGYPRGLKGDEIGIFGQMAAIVDVYDAITSDRVYHKGNTPHQALKRMLEWSRHHFSPVLYQQFVQVVGIYPIGTLVRLENGLVAVVLQPSAESLLHPTVKVVADGRKGVLLQPHDLNLMEKKGDSAGGYKIVGVESAEKWKINPRMFLPEPKLFE